MEMDLINVINNVGFPIAVSVALFYQLMKTDDLIRDFEVTIAKNTSTIERLLDTIEEFKKERGINV